jgi:hypothetical protein
MISKHLWFIVGLVFVSAVASFDTYRCISDRLVLSEIELNPIARRLIELDHGDVRLLVAGKTLGLALVIGCVVHLAHRWPRMSHWSLAALVVVQAVTLWSLVR